MHNKIYAIPIEVMQGTGEEVASLLSFLDTFRSEESDGLTRHLWRFFPSALFAEPNSTVLIRVSTASLSLPHRAVVTAALVAVQGV